LIVTRLKQLLESHNISINELSERIKVGRRPLTQLANNESKMVKFETIEKLMSFFRLSSFDELLLVAISDKYTVTSEISHPLSNDDFGSDLKVFFHDANNESTTLPLKGTIYTGSDFLLLDLTGEWDNMESQTTDFLAGILSIGQQEYELLARDITLSVLESPAVKNSKISFSKIIFKMPIVSIYSDDAVGNYLWNAHDLIQESFLDSLDEKYSTD